MSLDKKKKLIPMGLVSSRLFCIAIPCRDLFYIRWNICLNCLKKSFLCICTETFMCHVKSGADPEREKVYSLTLFQRSLTVRSCPRLSHECRGLKTKERTERVER